MTVQVAHEFKRIMEDLIKVRDECKAGWDGYGAKPVSDRSFQLAGKLLAQLESMPSDVGVDPDGCVTLEWYNPPELIASVSVNEGGTLDVAVRAGAAQIHGRLTISFDEPTEAAR